MPKVQDKDFITFNSGVLDVCGVKERTIVSTKYNHLRFGDRTVGVTRFWKAKVASTNIDRLVVVPQAPGITQSDMCIIEGRQYKIKQVQSKFDTSPPCLFLSLEENNIIYKDNRTEV